MSDGTPRRGAKANCKHCGRIIIFEPYYCDGKLPNPDVWYHLPGYFVCWVTDVDGKRGAPTRKAEPLPRTGELVDVKAILHGLDGVRGLLPKLRLTAAQRAALAVARAPKRSRNPLPGSLPFLPRTAVVEVAAVEDSTPYAEGWISA